MPHFLQSAAWEQFQHALGRTVITRAGDGWSYLAVLERGRLSSRLYCPYGPVITRPGALPVALAALAADGAAHKVTFVRFEPTGQVTPAEVAALNAHRVRSVQPEHTLRIPLDRPFEEILKDFSATNRNLHRNYAKKSLTVRASTDPSEIEHLLGFLHGVAANNQMNPQPDSYLRTQAQVLLAAGAGLLYVVEFEGVPVGSALLFDDADTRYYAHAAADYEHRRLSPGTVLLSQMIEDAHAAGRKEFDLMGVVGPEAGEDHPWYGFSKFKRSFGGNQVDYAGTWELPVSALRYRAYRLALQAAEQAQRLRRRSAG